MFVFVKDVETLNKSNKSNQFNSYPSCSMCQGASVSIADVFHVAPRKQRRRLPTELFDSWKQLRSAHQDLSSADFRVFFKSWWLGSAADQLLMVFFSLVTFAFQTTAGYTWFAAYDCGPLWKPLVPPFSASPCFADFASGFMAESWSEDREGASALEAESVQSCNCRHRSNFLSPCFKHESEICKRWRRLRISENGTDRVMAFQFHT